MNGNRALDSVLSKNVLLYRQFQAKYGEQYRTVREYYLPHQNDVKFLDASPWLAGLVTAGDEANAEL